MSNQQIRLNIKGMTCTGCENSVESAIQQMGAKDVKADFYQNEVLFDLPRHVDIESVRQAVNETHYRAGDYETLESTKPIPAKDNDEDYDLIIIGSGGGAFSAAIKATENGGNVAMIERGTVGGTCVNIGCVPSKTMLRAGEINQLAKKNPFVGLSATVNEVNLSKLVEQKDELVGELRKQKYEDLIEEYGFELIRGEARFVDEKTVEVNGTKLTGRSFLIATGASPSVPNIPGLKDVGYLTSTTLLELKQLPKSLAVIGAGYIGLELGQLFHNLGVEVTLMKRGERLLKEYDPEISDSITKMLTEQGIKLIASATFEQVEENDGRKVITVTIEGEKKVVEAEQLLVATGRKPNIDSLNLSVANVDVGSRGEILIDDYLQTSNKRIHAAGDVTLGPQFVYVAAYQGGIVADNTVGGLQRKSNLTGVPGVTFTNPAIATVGLTEEQAKEKGYQVKTSVLPLDAVPRALVNHETTGVFKIVAEADTLKVLGVHVVAENAGDVIYAATLVVKHGLTIEDLQESFAPYLTMAEGLKLTALTFDKDVSKLSCCAG
ncbi:mercury(II) reductase [Virgibacillus sp. DJP39]|uniref:mercury(II) reductase n=1 Tax=Virgibacillus sp. DJP39 TaxID=3409790 RepID=UPI003BB70D78